MPTSLTGSKVRDTYGQLLHVDGGIEATEKPVRTGAGAASALNLGTGSASVGNVRIAGNAIAPVDPNTGLIITSPTINGGAISGITDLAIADGGTGSSTPAGARSNLGLGSLATQSANDVNISGGVIAGITDLAIADGGTGASTPTAARANLELGTLATQNANAVSITGGSIAGITDLAVADGGTGASTPAGARTNLELGSLATQNANSVAITGGTISFNVLSGRAFGMFSDVTDQTGNVSTPLAIKFGTNELTGNGISIANDGSSNPTRITFAAAGTYMIAISLQFNNSDAADHDVYVWFRKNGTDIARSNTRITVPKTGDGGAAFFQVVFYDTVTAGQYIEAIWLPENAAITLDHTAAVAGPPAIPAIPSAIVVAERIA